MVDGWSTSDQSTQPNPGRGQVFVGSHGAGATAASLGVQLENEFDSAKLNRTGFQSRSIWALRCPSLAFVSGNNDGMLGVVMVMVLQIVAGLVSALLSISRLNLKGQKTSLCFRDTGHWAKRMPEYESG